MSLAVEDAPAAAVWESFARFLSASRKLRKLAPEDARARAVATVRVAVIGNTTLEYLADAIALALAPRLHAELFVGGFDQWAHALFEPAGDLAAFGADIVVVHLASLGFTGGGSRLNQPPADIVRSALAAFAAHSTARVILVLPEPLADATGGTSDADEWHRAACSALRNAVTDALPGRSAVLDPANALATLQRPWHAQAYWGSAKLPFHPLGCIAVGRRVAQMIENMTAPRVKVVAVDCDDTLWGGIAGDVGAAGVELSPFGSGAGHLQLQRLLKEAAARGIVLAAVSKNEPETVAAVFRERAADMILAESDFAAFRVGWGPKSHALREIADELQLGLDAFLFLDDSAFERGEVRAALPEVLVPELPAHADAYAACVAALGVLERPIVGDEDRRRTELYRDERSRSEARSQATSVDEYVASLAIQVEASRIDAASLDRAVQLVAKTNQFNVTTRRYGRDALAALAADPATYAFIFRVTDRFGDAGAVGVAIATPSVPGEPELDAFLMSCRVMGRTVEDAMMRHVLDWHAARGMEALRATYLRTPKNTLVADLFPRFGFAQVADGDQRKTYRIRTASGPRTALITLRDIE